MCRSVTRRRNRSPKVVVLQVPLYLHKFFHCMFFVGRNSGFQDWIAIESIRTWDFLWQPLYHQWNPGVGAKMAMIWMGQQMANHQRLRFFYLSAIDLKLQQDTRKSGISHGHHFSNDLMVINKWGSHSNFLDKAILLVYFPIMSIITSHWNFLIPIDIPLHLNFQRFRENLIQCY